MKFNRKDFSEIKLVLQERSNMNTRLIDELERRLHSSDHQSEIASVLLDSLKYGEYNNYSLPEVAASTEKNIERLRFELKKLETVKNAITTSGFKTVTFGLPFFPLTIFSGSFAYSYLLLSGIKRNAKEKDTSSPLFDDTERDLFFFETKMADLIDDDYRVDMANMAKFLDLLKEYLQVYFVGLYSNIGTIEPGSEVESRLYSLDKHYQTQSDVVLTDMMLYMVYTNLGIDLRDTPTTVLSSRYVSYLIIHYSDGEAMSRTATELIEDYRMEEKARAESKEAEVRKGSQDKNLNNDTASAKKKRVETMETESSIEEKPKTLSDYVQNGLVYRTCDIDKFLDLLEASGYSDEKKTDLLDQMQKLIDKESYDRYIKCLNRYRSALLSEEKEKLYHRAKSTPSTSGLIDEIDATIELMFESKDPEETKELTSNLHSLFESLTFCFGESSSKNEQSDAQKVAYITSLVLADDGSLKSIPKLLLGINSFPKDSYKALFGTFNKLLNGYISGDQEVYVQGLPCRIWLKGKDSHAIAYTVIKDTVIIIDVIEGIEPTKKLLSILKGDDFKNQIGELKELISKDELPNSNGMTKAIVDELEKSKAVKKMIIGKKERS